MRALRAISAAVLVAATAARADEWRADLRESRVVVHVFKKGLFSGFAHDHHFEVTDWSATAAVEEEDLARASVDVRLSARSLRDRQEELSDEDRRKVDAQAAGPEVLDAARHPTIRFRSTRLELAPGASAERLRGTLHGELTVRGETRPAAVELEGERAGGAWRLRGRARARQTDFGIRPFSGFGGTVGVKDELRIEIALVLRRQG